MLLEVPHKLSHFEKMPLSSKAVGPRCLESNYAEFHRIFEIDTFCYATYRS